MRSLLLFFVLAACGHDADDIDSLVGSRCESDRDCDEQCLLDSGDFPGGFCTVGCDTDNDCPAGTLCMSTNGGVCLYACPDFDCDRLGPGWGCRARSRESGGDANVCHGD